MLKFTPEQELYTFDPSEDVNLTFTFTKDHQSRTKDALAIADTKLTTKDVRRTEVIYGKLAEYLQRESYRSQATISNNC